MWNRSKQTKKPSSIAPFSCNYCPYKRTMAVAFPKSPPPGSMSNMRPYDIQFLFSTHRHNKHGTSINKLSVIYALNAYSPGCVPSCSNFIGLSVVTHRSTNVAIASDNDTNPSSGQRSHSTQKMCVYLKAANCSSTCIPMNVAIVLTSERFRVVLTVGDFAAAVLMCASVQRFSHNRLSRKQSVERH